MGHPKSNTDVGTSIALVLSASRDRWMNADDVTMRAIKEKLYVMPPSRKVGAKQSTGALSTQLGLMCESGKLVRARGRDTREGRVHRMLWYYCLPDRATPLPDWLDVSTPVSEASLVVPKEDSAVEAAAQQRAEAMFVEAAAKKQAEAMKARIDARAKQLLADMLKGV